MNATHGRYSKYSAPAFVIPEIAEQEARYKADGGVLIGAEYADRDDAYRAGKIAIDPQTWVTWQVRSSKPGRYFVELDYFTNNDAWDEAFSRIYTSIDAAAKVATAKAARVARIMVKCGKENGGFIDANDVLERLG